MLLSGVEWGSEQTTKVTSVRASKHTRAAAYHADTALLTQHFSVSLGLTFQTTVLYSFKPQDNQSMQITPFPSPESSEHGMKSITTTQPTCNVGVEECGSFHLLVSVYFSVEPRRYINQYLSYFPTLGLNNFSFLCETCFHADSPNSHKIEHFLSNCKRKISF